MNINAILKKYGARGVREMKAIVGVKTGRLKASLAYNIQTKSLTFRGLFYGTYYNPWSRKSPGIKAYIDGIPGPVRVKVLNTKFYDALAQDLGRDVVQDILFDFRATLKKYKR